MKRIAKLFDGRPIEAFTDKEYAIALILIEGGWLKEGDTPEGRPGFVFTAKAIEA